VLLAAVVIDALARETDQPHAVVDRGDHDAAEHAVHSLAATAEQAGAADHRSHAT
jgi:hypothetical protein